MAVVEATVTAEDFQRVEALCGRASHNPAEKEALTHSLTHSLTYSLTHSLTQELSKRN